MRNLASNPEFAWPDKHFSMHAGIDWRFNARGSVGYGFRYHYMQADTGLPYQHIEQAIHYKLTFMR